MGAPESEQAKNRTKMKAKVAKDLFFKKKTNQSRSGIGFKKVRSSSGMHGHPPHVAEIFMTLF